MLNFLNDLYYEPTDNPTELNVTLRVGKYLYQGILVRELTELELLRNRVAELESILNQEQPQEEPDTLSNEGIQEAE